MKYEYKNDKGDVIDYECGMLEDKPSVISRDGEEYYRVFGCDFFMNKKYDNQYHKSMDDFRRSKISKGNVKVKSPSGKSYVPAQLRIDADGEAKLVYKNNPVMETGIKPTNEIVDTLSKNMENYL